MLKAPVGLVGLRLLGFWQANNSKSAEDDKVVDSSAGSNLRPEISQNFLLDPRVLNSGIERSSEMVRRLMLESGVPGLTLCVAKKGEILWEAAFGYCDVENQVPCSPDASMRIASISKSIFASTMVAPLIEKGKLGLEDSIHKYLTLEEFPKPKFEGNEYDLTVKQILSHTSGIRSYDDDEDESRTLKPIGSAESMKVYQSRAQFNREGFFQRETFRSVIEALRPFKNDPLKVQPGQFSYTTYGYTLLSAIVQKVLQDNGSSKQDAKEVQVEDSWMKTLRRDWKMHDTHLDQDEKIIPRRARYYMRTCVNGGLINAPYQDSSVKWAGGGLISTTRDLASFGMAMIDCYKGRGKSKLKRETVELFWSEAASRKNPGSNYGLGFAIKSDTNTKTVYHTGSALGASSVLLIQPETETVVVILSNLGSINLLPLSLSISEMFKKVC